MLLWSELCLLWLSKSTRKHQQKIPWWQAQRAGSARESRCCRGPRFVSQHLQNTSQPPPTPLPRDLIPPLVCHTGTVWARYTRTHVGRTLVHTQVFKIKDQMVSKNVIMCCNCSVIIWCLFSNETAVRTWLYVYWHMFMVYNFEVFKNDIAFKIHHAF